ncbi:MAG TPA: GntR family transcriptional regulator [Pyrinomonadaceae bacterium]|jgi:DNA-binding GntR family transcriptional regulator|nr:GntR family transcriptional regulator [Pyrinomonadaceae bacterium]
MVSVSPAEFIQKEVLRDKIYELLKGWILGGKLKPGEKVVELALAKQLNVSRAPLREALLALSQQGFITIKPHQGSFVTELSGQDITEIFEVREVLEIYAAKKVRRSLTPERVAVLKRGLEELEEAARNRDVLQFAEADLNFHRALWSLAGNSHLEKLLIDISTRFFGYEQIRDHSNAPDFKFEEMVEEHRRMVNLVLSGSDEEVEVGFKHAYNEFLEYVLQRFGEKRVNAAEPDARDAA